MNFIVALGALVGLFAVFAPWLSFRANRLVPGEGVAFWAFASPLKWIVLGSWLLALCFAWTPKRTRAWPTVLLAALAALAATLLIGVEAARLMSESTPFARVSPSAGTWLSLLAVYVVSFGAARDVRFGGVPTLLAVIAPPLLGAWRDLGPMLELRNVADTFGQQLVQHAALSVVAVLLATLVGLPLGVAAARNRRLEGAVLATTGFFQTVPSLALFGVLLPILAVLGRGVNVGTYLLVTLGAALVGFALTRMKRARVLGAFLASLGSLGAAFLLGIGALNAVAGQGVTLALGAPLADAGLRGIGSAPALVALTLYALLPIVTNTFVGLRSVPEGVRDAARGMGMTPRQVLMRAEVPLAWPFILDGLRGSLVLTFGLTTIAALIGAGGLGFFILRGVESGTSDLVLLGAVPIVVLALALDAALKFIARLATPKGLRT
ncbi:ABC transporter permease [Deinococcus yavapaiensis]|uniref:Osmoprotectant transport system permease protein n=1 Tax=Deinococcus yavapaiensis KR-236 TaxID=694435 RepID=A0A318S7G9_9DEIO|nr:ABC transporter permease [Deinococcus yavapaiensis]PYE51130.1 osmoprotectant transport system permease protein [Deinococcus yavapaiensis KR-236]